MTFERLSTGDWCFAKGISPCVLPVTELWPLLEFSKLSLSWLSFFAFSAVFLYDFRIRYIQTTEVSEQTLEPPSILQPLDSQQNLTFCWQKLIFQSP